MRGLVLCSLLCCAACPAVGLVPDVDNGGRFAERVKDPKVDRCETQKEPRRKKDCLKAKDGALEFVRRLSVDDQLCLDGNPMSDGLTSKCKARAFVSDVGVNKVKVEVREVGGGTRYKHMQEIWYTEAALVDDYLKSLGYELNE
jgi:hypothetical protein